MNSPVLPESAPFSPEQRMWLNGFIAGLSNFTSGASSQIPSLPQTPALAGAAALPVLILYGSQSGTAEGLAQALADKLKVGAGSGPRFEPRVLGMEKFKDVAWASESRILLLTSTWGDGDMPDNGVAFWDWLKSADAPMLPHLTFAVFGLGDRSYTRFCQAGKNLDGRLAELGAKKLLPLCECDTDYEAPAEKWMGQALAALEAMAPASASSQAAADLPAPAALNGHANGVHVNGHSGTDTHAAPAKSASLYSRKNPFHAPLLENRPLNTKGSGKDTRHISISLLGSGLEYRVGDALGVIPRNCYDLVDRIILTLNCSGNERLSLDGGEEITLRSALINKLDLRRGSERLLKSILETCRNPAERRRLVDLTDDDGSKAKAYLSDKDVLDMLEDFPHTRLDAQHLIAGLGKIAPRLYSISSSPKEHPGEVHLTIGIVRYGVNGRIRKGVTSTFLAERLPLGMTVPVFVQPAAHFGLPAEPGKPIIMVGPGTGIAPFRAFLQERSVMGDPGKNWLFFGDQCRKYDFLYNKEFMAMQASGFLTRMDLAFSRDQPDKIYVQDRMLENSRDLYAWLEEGAYFYVCGDAKRMAKDVEAALLQVIAKESGNGPEEALAYLDRMKEQKRYLRDVY